MTLVIDLRKWNLINLASVAPSEPIDMLVLEGATVALDSGAMIKGPVVLRFLQEGFSVGGSDYVYIRPAKGQ